LCYVKFGATKSPHRLPLYLVSHVLSTHSGTQSSISIIQSLISTCSYIHTSTCIVNHLTSVGFVDMWAPSAERKLDEFHAFELVVFARNFDGNDRMLLQWPFTADARHDRTQAELLCNQLMASAN